MTAQTGVIRVAYSCGCVRTVGLDQSVADSCLKHPEARSVSHIIERETPRFTVRRV